MAANTGQMSHLPSGGAIFCTIPDIFYLPELVFGGLTWTLVASTFVEPHNPQGYVMAVSIFCFCATFVWMLVFVCGTHRNKASWAAADVAYHGVAAFLYLSSSVALAMVTLGMRANASAVKFYKMDISAVVFSYAATLLYFVHTIFSAIRWKSF